MAERRREPARVDLTNFTIREMSECGKAMRAMGEGAGSMEEAAERIVRHFHDGMVDGGGKRATALVRLYKTHSFCDLDDEFQGFVRKRVGGEPPSPDMKCLVLLATAGEKPEWNSRKCSQGHKAIPLPSVETVKQAPMVSNLIKQLGLTIGMVVRPDPKLLLDMEQRTFNVFHVPEALGSPFIPAQQDFVVPYGIRSVLGFGGLLPSGEMFAVILFCYVPVSRESADLFKALSLNVKMALLPFDGRYSQAGKAGRGNETMAAGKRTEVDIRMLNSRTAALEQLIEVYENSVVEQAEKLYGEIAERRRAERSLTESEALLRTLLQTIPDLVWLKDENGVYLACNTMFARFFGAGESEIIGRTDYDFVEKELADYFRAHDLKAMTTGKASVNEEWITFADDGHRALLETIKTPLFDIEGKVIGVLGVGRDITGRKRAEEEIRELLLQNRMILESAGEGIYGLDMEGKTTFVNPAGARMIGYEPEELIGELQHAILHHSRSDGTPYPREECPIYTAFMTGMTHHVDNEVFWRKDGTSFPVEYTSTPLWKDGKLTGAVVVFKDIAERRRAEEEIRRLNAELELKVEERTRQLLEAQEELLRKEKLATLGQLSGSVGHELRNPLGVMSNAVYFLETVLADSDETVREYLGIIKKEIDTSHRIITDLLDFARTKPPQTKTISPLDLIEACLAQCELSEKVQPQIQIPAALPLLKVDPLQIGQVFQNLITNAVQAMPEGGALKIAARRVENGGAGPCACPGEGGHGEPPLQDFIEISVADTGEGISPENVKRLFQPLFTTKAKGIGLGLVVCKNLTEANGGRIGVVSRLGEGTTFSVMLPEAGE